MNASPIRILIAETDPFMRRALETLLAKDYTLTFVEDGETLLQQVHLFCPHLIILELLLPHKDGFQVCRALKSEAATRDIPILCFTFLQAEERARAFGADAFLSKPLRDEEMLKTIHQLLRISQEPSS